MKEDEKLITKKLIIQGQTRNISNSTLKTSTECSINLPSHELNWMSVRYRQEPSTIEENNGRSHFPRDRLQHTARWLLLCLTTSTSTCWTSTVTATVVAGVVRARTGWYGEQFRVSEGKQGNNMRSFLNSGFHGVFACGEVDGFSSVGDDIHLCNASGNHRSLITWGTAYHSTVQYRI